MIVYHVRRFQRSIFHVTVSLSLFPNATVLLKMHMLECYMVPWLKKWKIGCGYMGEQGAESLLGSFNNTERAYNNYEE